MYIKGLIIFVQTTNKCTCKCKSNPLIMFVGCCTSSLVHSCNVPLMSDGHIITHQEDDADMGIASHFSLVHVWFDLNCILDEVVLIIQNCRVFQHYFRRGSDLYRTLELVDMAFDNSLIADLDAVCM